MTTRTGVFIGSKAQRAKVLRTSRQAYEFYEKQLAAFLGMSLKQFRTLGVGGPTALLTISMKLPKGKSKLEAIADGLEELKRITNSKATMNTILREAYQESIGKYLQTKWPGVPTRTGGEGQSQKAWNLSGERTGKDTLRAQSTLIRTSFKKSVWASNFRVGLPSLKEYATRGAWNLSSPSRSAYTSTFMILEFGTGEKAKPGPRPYQSAGATPHKVHPILAAPTGRWFSWTNVVINRAGVTLGEAAKKYVAGAKAAKKAETTGGKGRGIPYLTFPFEAFWRGHARDPYNIFFTASGRPRDFTAQKRKFRVEMLKRLLAEIRKTVTDFPDILSVAGRGFGF
jgi:hypothetical protein